MEPSSITRTLITAAALRITTPVAPTPTSSAATIFRTKGGSSKEVPIHVGLPPVASPLLSSRTTLISRGSVPSSVMISFGKGVLLLL